MRLLCIKNSDGGYLKFPAPSLVVGREYTSCQKIDHFSLIAIFFTKHLIRIKLLEGDYYRIEELNNCWYHEHHFIEGMPTAEEELEYAEPSELVLA